jgi:hypothetical protein
MMQRVERALVRLSRDRYMSPAELLSDCRKLVDCAQLRCGGFLSVRSCLPPGSETLGLLRGKTPVCPMFDVRYSGLVTALARICRSKNRKAKAELEILNYHTRTGAYKWIPHK